VKAWSSARNTGLRREPHNARQNGGPGYGPVSGGVARASAVPVVGAMRPIALAINLQTTASKAVAPLVSACANQDMEWPGGAPPARTARRQAKARGQWRAVTSTT
jgi:hypothetical protein